MLAVNTTERQHSNDHLCYGMHHGQWHVGRDNARLDIIEADAAVEQNVRTGRRGEEGIGCVVEEGKGDRGSIGCIFAPIMIDIISRSIGRGAEHACDWEVQIGSSARNSRKPRLRCRQEDAALHMLCMAPVKGRRGLLCPTLCCHRHATLLKFKVHVIAAIRVPVAKGSVNREGGAES